MEENGQTLSEYDTEDESFGDVDNDNNGNVDGEGEIHTATRIDKGNDVKNTNEKEPVSVGEVSNESIDNLLKESSQVTTF